MPLTCEVFLPPPVVSFVMVSFADGLTGPVAFADLLGIEADDFAESVYFCPSGASSVR